MKFNQKVIYFFLFLLFFTTLPHIITGSTGTEIDWPTSPLTGKEISREMELHDLIAYLYGWGIMIAILAAFGMIVFGGFLWMTSEGDSKKLATARSKITFALLGLILALSSWLILNTINPRITQLTPFGNFWEELPDTVIPKGHFSAPDCHFAVLYSEKNFSGSSYIISPGERVGLSGGGEISVGSNNIPPGMAESHVEGGTPYLSGKGFVKITNLSEHEKEMLEAVEKYDQLPPQFFLRSVETPDMTGNIFFGAERKNNSIEYPNACLLTIYKKDGSFRDLREIAMIPLPNENFSGMLWEDENPHRYELREPIKTK